MNYCESVECPVCTATPGEPCEFTEPAERLRSSDKPDGTRPVHAARYAMTLPESERGEFWEGAIERWARANVFNEGSQR